MKRVKLVLETGDIYIGRTFANGKQGVGELIFNTSMSGYEEILTDPSYKGQFVMMTYPLIGNYGVNEKNNQSNTLHLSGLIVKEYSPYPSNWQATSSLKDYLEAHDIVGIEGVDTRLITRQLRHLGAAKILVTDSNEPDATLIERVRSANNPTSSNLAQAVSCTTPYTWTAPDTVRFRVAVVDCGVKFGILDHLRRVGCAVDVLPYNTTSASILDHRYDGVLISNGPGDPAAVTETIDLIRELLGKLPLFGICLGHQMLCHAAGFSLTKLPFGHHGINHPIKNLATGLVEISSQNHIYCATADCVPEPFAISHLNLNDNTVAGIRSDALKAFSVQYHPEAAPGPNDSAYLFKDFTYLMSNGCFEHRLAPIKEGAPHA